MTWIAHIPFFRGFAALTGGRLIGAAAAFLASLIIARRFGPETLGEFSVLLAFAGILSVLAAGGFPAIASIFTAKYSASSQISALKGFVRAGIRHLAAAAIVSLGVAFFYLAATGTLQSDLAWTALATGVTALGIAAMSLFGAVLVGLNRQQAGLLPDTMIKPILFLVLVAIAALTGLPVSATGLLAFFALAASVAAAYTFLQLRSEPFMARSVISRRNKTGWRKTTYPWIITTLVWDFFIELHIILAGWIAAPAEVAVLHVAFRFRMLAGYGMRALYALFLPDIVAADAKGRAHYARTQLMKVNLIALGYSAGIMGVFTLAGGLLMGLFGSTFSADWPLLVILSGTMVIRAVFGPAPAFLAMKGYQIPSAIVMLGCLIFSLASALVFYPQTGLVGIAASYTAANLFASAILWLITRRLTGIDCSLFSLTHRTKKEFKQVAKKSS